MLTQFLIVKSALLGLVHVEGCLLLLKAAVAGDVEARSVYEKLLRKPYHWNRWGWNTADDEGAGLGQRAPELLSRELTRLEQAGGRGSAWALNLLGHLYERGELGVGKDAERALALFRAALLLDKTRLSAVYAHEDSFPFINHSDSKLVLAYHQENWSMNNYSTLLFDFSDLHSREVRLLRAAAAEGKAGALLTLASWYRKGLIFARDLPAAVALYRRCLVLGLRGVDVVLIEIARAHPAQGPATLAGLEADAHAGGIAAMKMLAKIYGSSELCELFGAAWDVRLERAWLQRAADLSDPEAKKRLAEALEREWKLGRSSRRGRRGGNGAEAKRAWFKARLDEAAKAAAALEGVAPR